MPPSPLVYCETNWIVALAFPHHQHHRLARQLREHAHRGDCEIRLPYAAILEARLPINDESNRLNTAFARLRDELANAVQNGHAEFGSAAAALGGDAMNQYLARPALDIIEDLVNDRAVVMLRDQELARSKMDELRPKLNFRGKDVTDLYLIAAAVGDRMANSELDRPCVFFSTNKKEFQPKGEAQAKLGKDFYDPYRMVWRDDFDLTPAIRHWGKLFVETSAS